VPALWSEEHKHFMREAAKNAGIIEEINSHNLLLSLEPEGASIQCREDAEQQIREQMVKDTVVMVLDCGGGTVDITIHKLTCEVEERFVCEELLPSSGGSDWGSKFVDFHFESFLKDFFGQDFYEDVYKKNAMARLEILKHFEMLKRKFNPGVDERSRLQLSYIGEDLSASQLATLVTAYNTNQEEIATANGKPAIKLTKRGASSVDLPPELMVTFFDGLFEKIKDKVSSLID